MILHCSPQYLACGFLAEGVGIRVAGRRDGGGGVDGGAAAEAHVGRGAEGKQRAD